MPYGTYRAPQTTQIILAKTPPLSLVPNTRTHTHTGSATGNLKASIAVNPVFCQLGTGILPQRLFPAPVGLYPFILLLPLRAGPMGGTFASHGTTVVHIEPFRLN